MSLSDLLIGKPIATTEERAEHIGAVAGIPVFGLDALSSAAYGPEAALTLLIPLGLAGIQHIVPISFAIIGLLVIVFISCRRSTRTRTEAAAIRSRLRISGPIPACWPPPR
jgi:hypothetical protein